MQVKVIISSAPTIEIKARLPPSACVSSDRHDGKPKVLMADPQTGPVSDGILGRRLAKLLLESVEPGRELLQYRALIGQSLPIAAPRILDPRSDPAFVAAIDRVSSLLMFNLSLTLLAQSTPYHRTPHRAET